MGLKKFLEYRIQIIRINGIQNIGVLENCDEQWVKLRKENEDVLYIPIHAIRLVKILS